MIFWGGLKLTGNKQSIFYSIMSVYFFSAAFLEADPVQQLFSWVFEGDLLYLSES